MFDLISVEEYMLSHRRLLRRDDRVPFEETKILSSESAYYPRLHKESVEIFKHGIVAMNTRDGMRRISKVSLHAVQVCNIWVKPNGCLMINIIFVQ